MFINARLGLLLLISLLCTAVASAQQDSLPTQSGDTKIYLDVVVTRKSGSPITGLRQQDFTVLDNKVPVTLSSFQALGGSRAPIKVILIVDAVNTGLENIAYERLEIDKFLRANGGHLPHPTAVAVFTEKGTQFQGDFSSDGNALSALLDQYDVSLRAIPSGFQGAADHFRLSLKALLQLANEEASRPGRKIIVWISPGWPLFSGSGVEGQMDSRQQQKIFEDVVHFSTLLRQGRITLYSIDPLGNAESTGHAFDWEGFVKGIHKPRQAEYGDMALQVIATQSGGLALTGGNNIAGFLQESLADTQAYYELSFDPPRAKGKDEYHHIEIRLSKHGLTARTRQGYYAQPLPPG